MSGENKHSDLSSLGIPAKGDCFTGRDISDTTTSTGWMKEATLEELLGGLSNLDDHTPDPGDEAAETDKLLVFNGSKAVRMDVWKTGSRTRRYLATQKDVSSNTTLSQIADLEMDLVAGGVYVFEAVLHVSAGASGGHKYRVAGSGGLTATTINYYVQAQTGTAAPTIGTRVQDLGSTAAGVTSATSGVCIIRGTIVVGDAGTLILEFAQNASNGTASSVLVGSCLEVVRVA
ncbi:MAG: hypothetical protein KIT08_01260 [Anaerolineales bacterium]|nr:MAG: hypothetical protein KIT08_01260 [Anaerolineales bacterium]